LINGPKQTLRAEQAKALAEESGLSKEEIAALCADLKDITV
jgi:hypothetical protein